MSKKLSPVIFLCRKCARRTQSTLSTRPLVSSYERLFVVNPSSLSHLNWANRQVSTTTTISSKRSKSSFGSLLLRNSDQDAVNKVVSDAEKIVGYPTSFLSLRCLLSDELSNVAMKMQLVGTKHPLLKTARGMILDGRHNRQMRGLIVMLMAKAAGPNPDNSSTDEEATSGIYSSQRSLAEITEVIHTANLIHKGVVNLDQLPPEEQGSKPDMAFGNTMAVLSGDYLLGSACSALADLGNPEVVASVASAIGDMMTAEFTQYTDTCGRPSIPDSCTGFDDWLRQTFLTFGSLLSKSCQSALMLGGHTKHQQDMAFSFGKNLTFSHQLSKDVLPFLDKNERNNLSLTSAPILIYKESASDEEFSRIRCLWEGGVANHEEIVSHVTAQGIVDVCLERCGEYRDKAISCLDSFPESDAKTALISMARVMSEPVR